MNLELQLCSRNGPCTIRYYYVISRFGRLPLQFKDLFTSQINQPQREAYLLTMAEDYSTPAWELSKENAAPLARGRNVKKLEKSLSKKSSGGDEQTKQTLNHFKTLVAQETDDPLIHWLSYIKYHQDAFPSDTNAQFLLMEQCARTLMNNPRYANDDRFVRVCIMYADKTAFPADVFKYLHQQKIGTKVAVFWIAWAFLAEKKEYYSFAETVFQKGISKEAQPLDHLKTRHKQFQRRMSESTLVE